MEAEARRFRHVLDAWRAEGADRIAPVRFHFIDALLLRAGALDADARRALHGKIQARITDYASRVTASRTAAEAPPAVTGQADTLASLTQLLAQRRTGADSTTEDAAASTLPAPASRPDALAKAQRIWTDVRTRSQVRQSLEQTAEDAGPLNSSRLVHRAIQVMGDCSPAYREHFLIYLDTLSWLQQLGHHGVLGDTTAAPPAAGKPRKPRKPRAPRKKASAPAGT